MAVCSGYDTIFSTQAKLLGQLMPARAVDSYERKLTALTRVDLLFIDDFGLKHHAQVKMKTSMISLPSVMNEKMPSSPAIWIFRNGTVLSTIRCWDQQL